MKYKKTDETISNYLKTIKDKKLSILLNNYSLSDVSIKLFFKCFEEVKQIPEDVAKFILDENNGYELSVFGHRASGNTKIDAYNGMDFYQGAKCTLGSHRS